MSIELENKRNEFIHKIFAKIDEKISKNEAKLVKEFAKQCYLNISPDDLLNRGLIDTYGSLISYWQFIKNKKQNETKIRIINPKLEQDGWQSTHTIIEMVMDDVPFLIDSIRMELNNLDINTHLMTYMGGVEVERDKSGNLKSINTNPNLNKSNAKSSANNIYTEAPIQIEIDKISDHKTLENIKSRILAVIGDVNLVVEDWQQMKTELQNVVNSVKKYPKKLTDADLEESVDFLNWMLNDNFTLLGYCDYSFFSKNSHYAFEPVKGSELGLFKKFDYRSVCHFCDLPSGSQKYYFSKSLLMIGKLNTLSTIHRPAYIDFISIKKFDKEGNITGEQCFIGLYTAVAYNSSVKEIPFIRKKITNVISKIGFSKKSHDHKTLVNILENLPRDDVFDATEEQIHDLSLGILHLQDRQKVRLFLRKDVFGRFFSCLVFVPKDIFNSDLREKFQKILLKSLNGYSVSFSTKFTESVLARIHVVVRIDPQDEIKFDVAKIEEQLIEAAKTWKNDLYDSLKEQLGEEKANELHKIYGAAFPAGYRESFSSRNAVIDIQHIENVLKAKDGKLEMSMYHAIEDSNDVFRFKLYHPEKPMPLSDVVPILENLGLRIISERPYNVTRRDGSVVWINDYRMLICNDMSLEHNIIRDKFQQAFAAIWYRNAENDAFNKLVLSAKITWSEVSILRSYYKYLWQVGLSISQNSVEDALFNNSNIALKIVRLFDLRFNPKFKGAIESQENLKQEIITDLEKVDSLTEDTIIRKYVDAIFATVRTNYYQSSKGENVGISNIEVDNKIKGNDRNKERLAKDYISFKFDSNKVPDIPLPKPLFEIFVYSPTVEGIHLRGDKVARGGLRWSDRTEDFRTEVLGLMKAQQVKNAVIVPLGAKGGFVVKRLSEFTEREARNIEVINCYKKFIQGLLDISDNIVNKEIVMPQDVVRYDEDDPYLVVAADKGTATFSDIANEISVNYGFWLGDAFASGGSTGYDHKKMGITARGAWESVKLHFQNINHDVQKEPFTVTGIGDMAGDVFGNGMLLSRYIKLVAAFNHMHIFIDPNPDTEKSFQERQRLFSLPRSTWLDYNKNFISKGGGVFSRSAKSITLTDEIKQLLNLNQDKIIPNDLIKAILKAKVDLFWNGGIGTFVKATTESHSDAGDRTNDVIRINANEVGAKVIGEGGNLGLTQLARVEYSKAGGIINTDAIDNSAGVNCSDNEVNIKVLLNDVVTSGDMTEKQRNQLLAKMTDEVAEIVLTNNRKQNMAITITQAQAPANIKMHDRLMKELEELVGLDRDIEFLPDKEEIENRVAKNIGLTRPEIAVILAYTKIQLKKDLIESDLPEDPHVYKTLENYFPTPIGEKYKKYMERHKLKREIIITQICNLVVDEMGIAFFHRLRDETGASSEAIVKCYLAVREIFDYEKIVNNINDIKSKVDYNVLLSITFELNRMMRRATRWFLRNRRTNINISETIELFRSNVQRVKAELPKLLHGAALEHMQFVLENLQKDSLSETIAEEVSKMSAMFSVLDIVEASHLNKVDVVDFATIYFLVGAKLELGWFREKIKSQAIRDHWDALARAGFRDDVDKQQRNIAVAVLQSRDKKSEDTNQLVEKWLEQNELVLNRWKYFVRELHAGKVEFTMFAVAIRELLDVSQCIIVESKEYVKYSV